MKLMNDMMNRSGNAQLHQKDLGFHFWEFFERQNGDGSINECHLRRIINVTVVGRKRNMGEESFG